MKKIKAFWKKLKLWQKWFFGLLIFLLFAGPASVLLTPPSPVDIYMAAPELETESPAPSDCKIAITKFAVSKYCGNSNFRYVSYGCADGYQATSGGPTSCKPIVSWLKFVTAACAKHPRCPSPKPTPTSKPTPTPIGTVAWSTQWASFSATDYKIQVPDGTINGRIFRVNPSKSCNLTTGEMVCVHSNPPGLNSQGQHYMTLEVTWFEYDIEMRMFIYLYSDGQRWWSNEIRVYNGQLYPNTEWVYFYGKFFDTPVGQAFTQSEQFRLSAPDPKTNGPVTLSFSNVRFAAFLNYFNPTPTPKPSPKPSYSPYPRPSNYPTPIPTKIPLP